MNWLLPVRRSVVRPQHLLRNRGAALPYAHALSLCRPRCSSTFCPSNITELLRPPPSTISPQQTLQDNETLTINGYVRTVRKQKRIAFAAIGDGSTLQTVQAVLPPQLAEGSVVLLRVTCKY
jgi:asparaginyl-tRNA synthetase